MPRPVVPNPGSVSGKWVRRAQGATQDYTDGAASTTKSQSAAAVAARPLWTQAMNAPATADRWAKGLARSGDEGWRAGVREKGGPRYGQGVATGEAKYGARIGKILSAIGAIEIPARGLAGSDTNFTRSSNIGRALNKLKGTFSA
jgi:hypothetical protein